MHLLITFLLTISDAPLISADAPPPPPSSAPRLVSAPIEPSHWDSPPFELAALATGAYFGSNVAFGLRGEFDVFRVAASFSWERSISTALEISDTQHFTGLAGWSVMANSWGHIRVLVGLHALSGSTSLAFAPVVACTAKVGFKVLALDASATASMFPFRDIDARAALVLRGGVFELHGGYRAHLFDSSATCTLASFFALPLDSGPYVAVGVGL